MDPYKGHTDFKSVSFLGMCLMKSKEPAHMYFAYNILPMKGACNIWEPLHAVLSGQAYTKLFKLRENSKLSSIINLGEKSDRTVLLLEVKMSDIIL